jgi:hypothetical protein
MKLIHRNPELQKNIWLELSTQRLILMPAIISLLLFLVNMSIDKPDQAGFLSSLCYMGLVGILIIWGGKVAHDNICNEYNERTWDWQRISAMSPLQLMYGKLFGSPVFNWYGGLICLVLWISFGLSSPNQTFGNLILTTISTLAYAIGIFSLSLMYALMRIRKRNGRDKLKGGVSVLLLLIFLSFALLPNVAQTLSGNEAFSSIKGSWIGYSLVQNLFYAIWGLIGLHQAMRKEMNYKNSSWLWYIFLFTSGIFSGIMFAVRLDHFNNLAAYICWSFTFHVIIIAYLMAIIETKEITQLRLLFKNLKARNFRYLSYEAPLWMLSLPLIFVGLILSWITFQFFHIEDVGMPGLNSFSLNQFISEAIQPLKLLCILLAAGLFIVRDFALMLFLNLGTRTKRADGAFILYLFLLYFLIPLLVSKADPGMRIFFIPSTELGVLACLFAPAAEAAFVIYLVYNLLRSQRAKAATTSGETGKS